MISIQRRILIAPALPGDINREHGKAMPIKHYRLSTDCDCTSTSQGPYRDTDVCESSYNPELSALKKVRNSGGTTRQTMSNAEYLKSRSKTYEQKSHHFVKSAADTARNLYKAQGSGTKLDSNGNPIDYCTTWKPSNKYFNQDGGVSNSTNINKIKYNTIQKHAKTMLSEFDKSVANAYAYSGRAAAPFTDKSKLQTAMPGMFRRKGNRQSCDVCK
jgi:hypothetical protein|uniref:Uncharacterized protein n=1 Tax=viral metagenome TaxID=1070528 RepID=A0A6C0BYM6_9ZZZZ